MVRDIAAAAFGMAILATASEAGLRDEKEINDGLVVIAAGDMIQRECDQITPRMIRAYGFARSLEKMAKDAGYSDLEIEEFVENKAEKARVKGLAKDYLISKGLDPARSESYCSVGRYEIDRNSQIGVLLKLK